MNPTPAGWPRLSPSLSQREARAAITFLARAFGFRARICIRGPEGRVEHSELEDGDAHHAQAVAAGATILQPPRHTDHGPGHWADRGYGALDPEGHRWWFATRIRNPSGS